MTISPDTSSCSAQAKAVLDVPRTPCIATSGKCKRTLGYRCTTWLRPPVHNCGTCHLWPEPSQVQKSSSMFPLGLVLLSRELSGENEGENRDENLDKNEDDHDPFERGGVVVVQLARQHVEKLLDQVEPLIQHLNATLDLKVPGNEPSSSVTTIALSSITAMETLAETAVHASSIAVACAQNKSDSPQRYECE
eukprot:2559457-Pleurochrysis_carterae.AAC.2